VFCKKLEQEVFSINRGFIYEIDYFYPQIVLTKVDKVEEKIKEMLKKTKTDEYQQEERLRELIDMKIEEVVRKLGVPRETVHFIENYHEKRIISKYELIISNRYRYKR